MHAHRAVYDVPVRALWDSFAQEVASDTTVMRTLGTAAEDRTDECILDVPVYKNHPRVLEAQQLGLTLPVPIAVYLDGVRFITQAAGRSES
eukprot:6906424-Pyramimonas_sp.AAC.1